MITREGFSAILDNMFSGMGAFGSVVNYLKKVATDILPSADDTYDLGSATYRWQDLHRQQQ